MKYDVFISHSSKDYGRVKEIVAFLEQEGLNCFVSYRDIPHCDNWADVLMDALKESRVLVYIHTEEANRSKQVGREVQIAIDNLDMPVITYRLCDEKFDGSLMFFLQPLNWIDSFPDHKAGLPQLLSSIKNTLRTGKAMPVARNGQGKKKKGFGLRWLGIMASLAFSVVAIILSSRFVIRQKNAFAADNTRMSELVIMAKAYMANTDSVEYSLPLLEEAAGIWEKYPGKNSKAKFTYDLEAEKEHAKAVINAVVEEKTKEIRNHYEGYRILRDEWDRQEALRLIDRISSICPSDELSTIKSALQ